MAGRPVAERGPGPAGRMLRGASIEVMPRTADKVADFRAILAPGTRVYIAHIDGTPFADIVTAAARLRRDGFDVMPHLVARNHASRAALTDSVAGLRDLGIDQALILAGGARSPAGPFASSLDLLDSGLLDGFARLHVAGHPEGNRDIAPDGADAPILSALAQKQAFAAQAGIDMAIVTQFVFDAAPVTAWLDRLMAAGITLPVHLGLAGPAKLQTLIRFGIACGVGPSLSVLQKRAADLTRLVRPFTPDALLADLARARAGRPDWPIEQLHLFPLGGIAATADYVAQATAPPRRTHQQ